MDKDILKMDYDTGVRAYLTSDGEKVFNIRGEQKHFYELDAFDEGCAVFAHRWHALRAYQDEQRKKGVPIRIKTNSEAEYWESLSNDDYTNYIAINGKPQISMERGPFDYIVFTNFRWREGYPKDAAAESRKNCRVFASDQPTAGCNFNDRPLGGVTEW